MSSKYVLILAGVWVVSSSLSTPTRAQTDPGILVRPWPEDGQRVELQNEPLGVFDSETDGGESLDVLSWQGSGRVRLDAGETSDAALGYRFRAIDLQTDDPALPEGLYDTAFVGAVRLGETFEGWDTILVGGAGSANDGHWSNTDAIYGIGAVQFSRQLESDQTLHLGIGYNGNRTILPDLPLPYAMWEHRVSDRLVYMLGVPQSTLFWRPSEPWIIQLTYSVPTNLGAKVTYMFSEHIGLFGEYARDIDAFWLHDRDNRRIFYEMSRLDGGVVLRWPNRLEARLGVGWAFDQQFSTGWDLRDTDTLDDPEDGLLLFLRATATF